MKQPDILKFFKYEHLPLKLQRISKPFSDMAHLIVNELPENEESLVALRKLLEAKDAAVRALVE
ncbi:hypothetical protein [Vibrio sp. McD22-P3]|uniref:hypothetical protein n=1 Tax=Vibrio sp. McD22-P3 TaxID=2724880 RepID=UPI001F1A3A85|nr:hypothetical protein [Vibrio sp. McD22-P3]MCF4173542.1 hypothetical protein [Vibrio sp. McD22-P3]